jgi:hypothetical protein
VMSRQYEKLPEEVETSILLSILAPVQSPATFRLRLERQPELYGTPNSSRRKAVTNRKYRLQKLRKEDPTAFLQVCRKFNLLREASVAIIDEEEDTKEEVLVAEQPKFRETADNMSNHQLALRSPPANRSSAPPRNGTPASASRSASRGDEDIEGLEGK